MSEWIQTYTGKKFSYQNCEPRDVCIRDIARALSHICRFTGHTKQFYSVAQHSVYVSERCKNPFYGLMHDAVEAYIGDMNSPLKSFCRSKGDTGYDRAETLAKTAIFNQFDSLQRAKSDEVEDCKVVDLRMLITEAKALLPTGVEQWEWDFQKYPVFEDLAIIPWHPEEAQQRFLFRFQQLTGRLPW